ncbi:YitT family protein [Clostridium sp. chh4-2]|uniref:YitT family protein n=1 Tax=Clostridium sp. chh4-2 TaxID=2067550 RepID=UPI000CCDBAA6|nr:YitT family protein [Clostridium sp. chh4-2]PNV63221.1 YitT family protein [Clostridium sp. chh4-2]
MNWKRSAFTDYLMIIAGSFIMGFAIKNMYDPVSLVTGGVSGIAIIFKNLFSVPLWVTNTVLNIPLFLVSFKIKGWKFIKKTFVATVALSLSLYIIPYMPFVTDDLFLASLFGGIISGIGAGMVFICQATTGGTDMLAALIQRKLRHYSIAQIMQVLDGVVVLAGATVFGVKFALYALIAIFAVSKISDGMIEGLKFSKQAFIVSDHYEEIAKVVMDRLARGVTAVNAVGMYSGNDKKMLFCVVSKKEIVQLKEIVGRIDPGAFVIVSDAREVFGEGFIEY